MKWTQSVEERPAHFNYMTNIYLTDSDEESIVDFVRDHEEVYDKTTNTIRKIAYGRGLAFANSHNLSVKVCKTWFESQRIRYGILTQSKSGQAPKEMTERKNYIQDKFNF